MNIDKLVKKYPEFFSKSNIGFHVGDGWTTLIEKGIIDLIKLGQKPYPQAVQIKEKFGSLRWYVDKATKEQYEIIDQVELQSFKICEECGEPGKLSGKS